MRCGYRLLLFFFSFYELSFHRKKQRSRTMEWKPQKYSTNAVGFLFSGCKYGALVCCISHSYSKECIADEKTTKTFSIRETIWNKSNAFLVLTHTHIQYRYNQIFCTIRLALENGWYSSHGQKSKESTRHNHLHKMPLSSGWFLLFICHIAIR